LKQMAAVRLRAFFRSNSHCAQNCAHSSDLERRTASSLG
jgi:hypothetical protein